MQPQRPPQPRLPLSLSRSLPQLPLVARPLLALLSLPLRPLMRVLLLLRTMGWMLPMSQALGSVEVPTSGVVGAVVVVDGRKGLCRALTLELLPPSWLVVQPQPSPLPLLPVMPTTMPLAEVLCPLVTFQWSRRAVGTASGEPVVVAVVVGVGVVVGVAAAVVEAAPRLQAVLLSLRLLSLPQRQALH